MGLAEKNDLILAEGNLENLSIKSKMYLWEPQLISSGPAKYRTISSFTSDKTGKVFTSEHGIKVLEFLTAFMQFEQFFHGTR